MPKKITHAEFQAMLEDLDVPDNQIADYLVPAGDGGGLNPEFLPNPEMVERDRAESAMTIGNGVSRRRRRSKFNRRIRRGENLPVIVSEGDSWFQFPFVIDDIIDHLEDDYLIWNCGAAGDTAANMIFKNAEYMTALDEQADRVTAFMLSAAGNDVIGEDENGVPVLASLLHRQTPTRDTVDKLINQTRIRPSVPFTDVTSEPRPLRLAGASIAFFIRNCCHTPRTLFQLGTDPA